MLTYQTEQIKGSASAGDDVGQGFFTYPCNTKLAAITVSFGDGKKYAVNPSDFNLGAVSEGSSSCVAGIVGSKHPIDSLSVFRF